MATRLPLGTYVCTLPILLELNIYGWKLAASHWRWSKQVFPCLALILDLLHLFWVRSMDLWHPIVGVGFIIPHIIKPIIVMVLLWFMLFQAKYHGQEPSTLQGRPSNDHF